ncbi:MAG: hypothetical protein PHQ98_03650 [Candidatus ainarchaeum sp.]|nr:hypothetical protein [Candidatus ainarchaeum sp.]
MSPKKRPKSLASQRKRNSQRTTGAPKPTGRLVRLSSKQIAKRIEVANRTGVNVRQVGANVRKFRVYGYTPDGRPIVGQSNPVRDDPNKRVSSHKPTKFSLLRKLTRKIRLNKHIE